VTPPEKVDLHKIYGQHFASLAELKRKYDPHNVFNRAVPRI